MTSTAPALEMLDISKSFAGNAVLSGVDLAVRPGEAHALVGENGAGKSTLMKILAGVHRPDAGRIMLSGEEVRFASPADALARGVAMIYQELSLAPALTAAENIFLGREPLRRAGLGLLDHRELHGRAARLLAELGFALDASVPVARLSAADRQLVEIARATVVARRVVVMDEPTSSLTSHEVDELFRIIERLKARGLAVVYISHRLEELGRVADRLTILRDGRVAYSGPWGELGPGDVIRHMAGRELKEIFPRRAATPGASRLRVEGLTRAGAFDDVSFEARAGEVVGIAGLAGSGRTELVEAIFGAWPAEAGEVFLDGEAIRPRRPSRSVARGLGLVTEDRRRTGLCLNLSVATNLTLANVRAVLRGWRLSRTREAAAARVYAERLGVRPPDPGATVARLSGGNQQKVLLGRWLFAGSGVILLDEPTRGVDVASRAEIYREISALAESGAAVVMVSSDLPELLGMSDRVLVLRRGRLVAELDARRATQEEVLRHAALEVGAAAPERRA